MLWFIYYIEIMGRNSLNFSEQTELKTTNWSEITNNEIADVLKKDPMIENFIDSVEHLSDRLWINKPTFIGDIKEYLDTKTSSKKKIKIADFVKKTKIEEFKEDLDNRSVEDNELMDEIIAVSDYCSTVLQLFGKDNKKTHTLDPEEKNDLWISNEEEDLLYEQWWYKLTA